MTRRRRIILGVAFVFFLMVCGLVGGTFVGGRYFVAPGSGLAGPAIALGYGFIGAGIAGAVGAALAWFLPPKPLLGVALPVILAGVVVTAVLTWLYFRSTAQQRAYLEQAYDKLNRFKVTLTHAEGARAPFRRMEVDWGARRYTVSGAGGTAQECAATLSGPEAVKLLESLRGVGGVVLKTPDPCAGTIGEVVRGLDWFIPEATPPDTRGTLAVTAACAARFPALDKPFEVAAGILRDGDHDMVCP